MVIDNQVVTGSQTNQMFVAQLSASGTVQYIKTNTGTGATNSNNISTNSSGNVFVAGQISSGTAIFDSITLPDPNGNGIFVVCLSPVGTVLSAKTIATEPSWSSFFISDLITDNQGNHFVAGAFMGDPVFGSIPVPNPTPGVQSVYLSRLDPAGNAVWAIAGGDASNLDVPKSLALGQNEDLFIAGNSSGSSNQPFSLAGLTVSNAKGYIFKVNAGGQYNHIAGRIFYDMNSDGIYNTTDAAAPATVLHVGSQYYNAESNGYYNAFTDSGTHIVSVSAPPYYNAVPGNHQVTFAGYGNVSNTADFALQPVPGMQDLQITLTSLAPPRPGFVFPLQITYRNAGTTLLSGSVELPLNSQLSFLQSMPAPSSQSGDTLIWNIGNLQPNQTGNIQIYASLPATAILGSIIHQLASVSPLTGDLTPADNTDTDSAIVVGSYDPNDKQVNLTSLTPTQIQTQEWLEYTIRFQNTGTDTAFTVRLADTLSALLNIPTIEILASSHPNTWSIKGTGIMEFRFDNILLPDSNINEPASHGFVKYRIKPKTTLALGDVIENTAYIYFDFNMPIVTNTATTEVKLINSVATLERNPLHIYPNPNNGTFTLQCSNIWQQQVSAELRNVLGQIVWTQILPVENGKLNQVIRTSNLPKGVYYLQLKTENGSKVQKVVIE
ncbi:MAG: T9SS type A sorting domain-containing protein [Sphingobacteriales bacterium]|nr:MAG: T9SS type A sorting domain-containing protein [Sphingobacteriales bacterium]